MSKRSPVLLTNRALRDILGIEEFSIATWGKKTATKYISDIQAALERLRENSGLLRPEADLPASLTFYSVNKHILVCGRQADTIILLTVLHGGMDLPTRLNELAPSLASEVEMLHGQLSKAKKQTGKPKGSR